MRYVFAEYYQLFSGPSRRALVGVVLGLYAPWSLTGCQVQIIPVQLVGSNEEVAEPSLELLPLNHDFGDVLVGTPTATASFWFGNSGKADATGCSPAVLDNMTDFTITVDSCGSSDLLADVGQCSVSVQANPASTGPKTATLSRTCSVGGSVTTMLDRITAVGVTPVLDWSPLSHAFGNQLIGTASSAQDFTLTNSGAAGASGCSAPSLSNTTDFAITADNCGTLDVSANGGTCTTSVRAQPTTAGSKAATLSRTCTVGGTVTTTANLITVTGVTPILSWSPLSYSFGSQLINTSSSAHSFTLSNSGTADATGCSAPTLSNTTDFTLTSDGCAANDVGLGGGSCIASVAANPASTGAHSTTLSRVCTVGGSVTTTSNLITVTGTSPSLAWSPSGYDFGNQLTNTNSAANGFVLTNSGSASATGCSAPVLSNTTDFTITADGCGTASLAAGGASCTTSVRANPTTAGAKTATLSRSCTVGGTVATTTNLITVTGSQPLPKMFCDRGDVNADGWIDSTDTPLVAQAVAGTLVPTNPKKAQPDLNGDGAYTAADSAIATLLGTQEPTVAMADTALDGLVRPLRCVNFRDQLIHERAVGSSVVTSIPFPTGNSSDTYSGNPIHYFMCNRGHVTGALYFSSSGPTTISQHVVGLITLVAPEVWIGRVAGSSGISSFDASLSAQVLSASTSNLGPYLSSSTFYSTQLICVDFTAQTVYFGKATGFAYSSTPFSSLSTR